MNGENGVTILTGIKPTGKPHLGNYIGAMRPALRLATDRRALFFIADYHALTAAGNASELRRLTYDVAASWLAAGLDPEGVIFYRQSDVPETFELFWLLCCVTPKGMMNRAHAYKAAVDYNLSLGQAPDIGVSMGLYGYPVLMAADILLFDANFVPVGKDQTQHVEMARDIADRFNNLFGAVLAVPDLLHGDDLEPIRGIDGRKMSKSYNNAIPLFATRDELRKLLRSYKTDSGAPDAPKGPGANGLFQIYAAFVDRDSAASVYDALASGNMTWGKLKDLTFDAIDADLTLLRQRFVGIRDDTAELDRVLYQGAMKARAVARNTMRRVHHAVGVGSHP